MTWFKLDDDFFAHPKVLAAGNAAVGLYCRMGSWCSKHSNDGRIPRAVALAYGARRDINSLVEVGLWEVDDAGYRIHDFNDYNPTPEQVAATRAVRAEAGRRGGKQRASKLLGNLQANDVAESNPGPVPVPITEKTDDNSESVPDPDGSSSSSFDRWALDVATAAARTTAELAPDVRYRNAWVAKVRMTMLEERADRIREAWDKGLSVSAAAEWIITEPVHVSMAAQEADRLASARGFGASCALDALRAGSFDVDHFRGEVAGMNAPVEWQEAAVAAYESHRPAPALRLVGE